MSRLTKVLVILALCLAAWFAIVSSIYTAWRIVEHYR